MWEGCKKQAIALLALHFVICSVFYFCFFGMVLCAHSEHGCEDDNLCQSVL